MFAHSKIAFCKLIYVFNDCDNMKHILKSKFSLLQYSQYNRLFKTKKSVQIFIIIG